MSKINEGLNNVSDILEYLARSENRLLKKITNTPDVLNGKEEIMAFAVKLGEMRKLRTIMSRIVGIPYQTYQKWERDNIKRNKVNGKG